MGIAEHDSNESRIPNPESRLVDIVRDRGPLTVAAFMELALYDPQCGYYARAARRSGRAGDFFTSVDVGPLFGELLELQIAEMASILAPAGRAAAENAERAEIAGKENSAISADSAVAFPPLDLVEAGAGDGRLSADILHAAKRRDPGIFDAVRLHLVDVSASARAAQQSTLGDAADRLVWSSATMPERFEGVLIANELLDALPTHQVVMRKDRLREIYVSRQSQVDSHKSVGSRKSGLTTDDLRLTTVEGPLSTPALQAYLDRLGVALEPGWRIEVNLRAVDWVRDATRRLARGFMILIDYGHDARDLYSATHSAGTLTSFSGHRGGGSGDADPTAPPWLRHPGERDITAHVDFTSIRAAAETEGMTTIAFLDQTYFLLGLVARLNRQSNQQFNQQSAISNQQLKTLILPGGLGSTMKVLVLAKGVGAPALAGCSFKVRVT